MGQIKASPDSQLRFSRQLLQYREALRKEEIGLFEDLELLGKTWKDEQFRQFERKLDEAKRELVLFHRDAARYADYLEVKGRAGFKFLKRGG